MCTDHDSHPPIAPISGAAIDAGTEIIKGAGGADLRVFVARPEQSTGAGILILPDVRGLHPFFEELASRFAERGITAVAMDYFCRTAGTDAQPSDFDYQPHLELVSWDNVAGDIRASVAHLRSQSPAPRSVFATGFCMGGRLSADATTLGIRVAQIVHHGSDHRSQVCTGLTSLGVQPPDIDLWAYGAEMGKTREVTKAPA
jgi:carboxymethylenebutenolidase